MLLWIRLNLFKWSVVILVLGLLLTSCAIQSYDPHDVSRSQPDTTGEATRLSPGEIADLIVSNPAEVDNSKLPITPVEELHITGFAPEVDIADYHLTVDGLVKSPFSLTYDAIMEYPTVSEVVLLICPDYFADNAEWTGVPLTTLLSKADIKDPASQVVFYALDGYKRVFSVEEVQRDGVFLAHTVNGQILPKEHGYPLRLVVKGRYGGEWVKWVEHIEVI